LLNGAELQGASLDEAQLQGASLLGAHLQGASLDRAELQGASLDGAELQGASLDVAQLQGASLDEAQLQGATLIEARVWRARGRFKVNLADVSKIDPHTMPWETDSTFAVWRDAVLETIPEILRDVFRNIILETKPEILRPDLRDAFKNSSDTLRDNARERLSALDPAAEEPENVITAQFWTDALSGTAHGEEREKQLAAFLADLACLRDAAPYVARGLIENGRLRSTGSQVAAVADRLRKGKSDLSACPGVRGFTDDDWAELDAATAGRRRSRIKVVTPP
jgi:Pentapeptide repeats (8 copies)